MLSQTIVDKAFLNLPFNKYRPHLWLIFIGPSTLSKKSTSMNLGHEIVKEAGMRNFLPTDFSPEALIEHMSEMEKGYMWNDEIGGLLKLFDREYMSSGKETLMKMYSGQYIFRKLRKESFTIEEPSVGIVGTTTNETMQDAMDLAEMYSGLGARFLQIHYGGKDGWKPISNEIDTVSDMKEELVDELRLIRNKFQIEKEMRFTSDAIDTYNEWDKMIDGRLENRKSERKFGSLYGRLSDYVIKFSMLNRVSRGYEEISPSDSELMIYEDEVDDSIDMVMNYGNNVKGYIRRALHGSDRVKVYDCIDDNEPISRSRLMRKTHLSSADLSAQVRTLKEMNLVTTEKRESSTKPATYYSTTMISMDGGE